MKNILILLFCFKLFTLTAQNSFEFTYGTNENEMLLNAIEDYSGNAIIVGGVGNRSTSNYDPLIIKVHRDGSYVVKRITRPDTNVFFTTINLLNDSNYLITGTYGLDTLNGFYSHQYLWVCKFDTNLNIIFEKSYRLVFGNTYTGVYVNYSIVDNNNNIIVVGAKTAHPFSDILLIKINQEGDTLFTRTHHFNFEQYFINFSTIPASNDYLGIAGLIGFFNNENNNNANDIKLAYYDSNNYGPIRFDSLFNIISIKHFYSSFQNQGTSDHWLNDTTYMYSCLTIIRDSAGKQQDRISVYNIDTALRYHKGLLLDKPDTSDYPAWKTSMAYADDSTIYIGGFISYLEFYPTKPNCIELYIIDTALNLLGYNEYGWDANYEVMGMISTSDNGCLLYGNYRTEENTTESDVYVLKVRREDFDIHTEIKKVDLKTTEAKVWPNPAHNKLFIKIPGDLGTKVLFQIFDLSGKEYTRQKITGSGNVLEVKIQPLSKGTYTYRVTINGFYFTGKFIKY